MDSKQLKEGIKNRINLLHKFEIETFEGPALPNTESIVLTYFLMYHTTCCVQLCKTLDIPISEFMENLMSSLPGDNQ